MKILRKKVRKSLDVTEDPFYRIIDLAQKKGVSLSNKQIDEIVYGLTPLKSNPSLGLSK